MLIGNIRMLAIRKHYQLKPLEVLDMNDIHFELKFPQALYPKQSYDWLEPIKKLRGFVLYENGLRPFFRKDDRLFYDEDCFEYRSYHIIAHYKGILAGCIRLLPILEDQSCVTSEIIGKENFRIVLQELPTHQKISESNRWIVHPNYKNTLIGHYLIYAAWALSSHIGYHCIGNGGFKMNAFIRHYGGTLLEKNAGPYYSEKYNDDVYIFYFDANRLSERAKIRIHKISALLGLEKIPNPKMILQKSLDSII